LADPQENINKFRAWKATMDDTSVLEYVHKGNLNKREIARHADIGYSAVKPANGNPQLIAEINEYQDELRKRGVLPELTEVGKKIESGEESVLRDVTSRKAVNAQRRASSLEEQNIALQAKVKQLEDELSRFKELNQVLDELGIIPR
jgi:hypothetical protein